MDRDRSKSFPMGHQLGHTPPNFSPHPVVMMLGRTPTDPVENLQTYFDVAMSRFLLEQQITPAHPNRGGTRVRLGSRVATARNGLSGGAKTTRQETILGVQMDSVDPCEYETDDLDLEGPLKRIASNKLKQHPT